jgi:hypothetical protein
MQNVGREQIYHQGTQEAPLLRLNAAPATHGQHVYSARHLIPHAGQAEQTQVLMRPQRHQAQVLVGGLLEGLWRYPQPSTWHSAPFPRAVRRARQCVSQVFEKHYEHGAHRLPRPAIFENVKDFKKSGGSEEFLGCLPRRGTAPVFVVCGGEEPKGKVFDVCGGRALHCDGIRGSDGGTETFKHGEESSEEVAIQNADSLERDADLGGIVSTYEEMCR